MNKRFSTITTAIVLSAGAILSPMSASAEEQKDLNVTYFISHTENEFNSTLAEAMEKAAEEKGINLTIVSADKDPATANCLQECSRAIAKARSESIYATYW